METTVLDYPEDAENLIARCGLSTTTDTPPSEYSLNEEEAKDFIEVGRSMELSSVFDFPQIIYEVKDVSRSFTHQHVRHRMAAHMQQSLRYAEIDPDLDNELFFITPPSIVEEGKKAVVDYIKNQLSCAQEYLEKIDRDVPSEDARFSLPIGTKTFLSTAMNVESLIHYFNVRACFESQWEIRSNAYALLAACKLIYPTIFQKTGPHCIGGRCRGRGKGECQEKAEKLIKDIEERVEQKEKQFNRLNSGEKLELDLTDLLGYKADEELEKEVGDEFGQERIDLSRKVVVNVIKS